MTEAGNNRPGRRPRLDGTAAQHLDRLRANKAQLDAEKHERERREDAALTKFVTACARVELLERERDEKLAELRRQADRLRADCKAHAQEAVADEVAALSELRVAGRTAEEIAALLELPKERVRRLLRSTRQPARRRAAPRAETADSPSVDDAATIAGDAPVRAVVGARTTS